MRGRLGSGANEGDPEVGAWVPGSKGGPSMILEEEMVLCACVEQGLGSI